MGYAYLTPFARSFIVIECAALFRNCDLRIGRERRVSDRAAQKTEGLFERAIVLFVGRHIGLRARFFGTFGLEMPAQRRLTLGIGTRLQIEGTSCSNFMSGSMPFAWMERPDGVK